MGQRTAMTWISGTAMSSGGHVPRSYRTTFGLACVKKMGKKIVSGATTPTRTIKPTHSLAAGVSTSSLASHSPATRDTLNASHVTGAGSLTLDLPPAIAPSNRASVELDGVLVVVNGVVVVVVTAAAAAAADIFPASRVSPSVLSAAQPRLSLALGSSSKQPSQGSQSRAPHNRECRLETPGCAA